MMDLTASQEFTCVILCKDIAQLYQFRGLGTTYPTFSIVGGDVCATY